MPDRIFAGVLLLVTLAYTVIAFTGISAPFQYDPLGPESWPRLLSVIALACILQVIWKPDIDSLHIAKRTWFRLLWMVVLMLGYAELYEPLGFIASTVIFATIAARMLGAANLRALSFSLAAGFGGYVLCVLLLELNLPHGAWVRAVLSQGAV